MEAGLEEYCMIWNLETGSGQVGLVLAMAILVLVSLCCCLCCPGPIIEPPHPRERPSEEDIVGTWVPTTQCLEWMEEDGGYEISTHMIVFEGNGRFEMVNWTLAKLGRVARWGHPW